MSYRVLCVSSLCTGEERTGLTENTTVGSPVLVCLARRVCGESATWHVLVWGTPFSIPSSTSLYLFWLTLVRCKVRLKILCSTIHEASAKVYTEWVTRFYNGFHFTSFHYASHTSSITSVAMQLCRDSLSARNKETKQRTRDTSRAVCREAVVLSTTQVQYLTSSSLKSLTTSTAAHTSPG